MEQLMTAEERGVAVARTAGALPADRDQWPEDARQAFRELLWQLDAWCRDRNHPRQSNSAVAEEAIRQAW